MLDLRHPNVIPLLGFCVQPPCITMEYCKRGSLYDILKSPGEQEELSWQRRLHMLRDAAIGMHYLHTRSPPIIHRDLKSPNLLVTTDWGIKVADMGMSKFVEDAKWPGNTSATTGGPGNPIWLAPEVLGEEKATTSSDVFSFGVVMWEVLTWQPPWKGVTTYGVSADFHD